MGCFCLMSDDLVLLLLFFAAGFAIRGLESSPQRMAVGIFCFKRYGLSTILTSMEASVKVQQTLGGTHGARSRDCLAHVSS